jgi:hypothetical protein
LSRRGFTVHVGARKVQSRNALGVRNNHFPGFVRSARRLSRPERHRKGDPNYLKISKLWLHNQFVPPDLHTAHFKMFGGRKFAIRAPYLANAILTRDKQHLPARPRPNSRYAEESNSFDRSETNRGRRLLRTRPLRRSSGPPLLASCSTSV